MAKARYITHDNQLPTNLGELRINLLQAIRAGIARVHRHPSSKSSVYTSAGGHLLMKWKLKDIFPQYRSETIPVDITAFPLYLPDNGSHTSFLETSVGAAALILAQHVRAPTDSATARAKEAATLIHDVVQLAIDEPLDDEGCEVLYGRAGLLYALLFLRGQLLRRSSVRPGEPDRSSSIHATILRLTADENVKALVDDIVARGQFGAKTYAEEMLSEARQLVPGLMWRWHGQRYLGGAHGVAGILQMLLCCPRSIVAPHWDSILNTIEWLMSIQRPSGNWPHKASRHIHEASLDEDDLVQWCHGAPGMLVLLSTLYRRHSPTSSTCALPDAVHTATRTALYRGGMLVYERGLLRKGVGLCHGIAGSVYALLAVAEALDDHAKTEHGEWFLRAAHLAQRACKYEEMTVRGEMDVPDRPYSLYEGVAGMCCAWADVVDGLGGSSKRKTRRTFGGIPGYSDLEQA